MKHIAVFGIVIFGLCLLSFSCKQDNHQAALAASVSTASKPVAPVLSKDEQEIQQLIRKVLNWGWSNNSMNLTPEVVKDSVIIGLDMEKHKTNLRILKETNFFTA